MTNKWSSKFFADLAERVGATFLGAVLTVLTVTQTTPVDWSDAGVVWTILGVPTLVSLIKGLLANLGNPESGASLLSSPPGPRVRPEGGYTVLGALGLGLIVLTVILLVLTLLNVVAVDVLVLVVLGVVGLVLLLIGGGTGNLRA